MTRLCAPPAKPARPCAGAGDRRIGERCTGFTMIEVLIVLVIAAILLAIGLPNFQDFIRDQRVRAIASDMVGDFALARTEAVRYSTRVIVARAGFAGCTITGTTWQQGWCIFADNNGNNSMDAGEQIKVQQAVGGQVRICSAATDFANMIVFGPRGQVIRASAIGADDGMTVTDDSTGAASARTRTLMFGLVGRVTTVNQNMAAPPC